MDQSIPKAKVDVSTSPGEHLLLGRLGEELAAAYLQKLGYRLVASNFVVPVGRNRFGGLIEVEIDLVAYDRNTLCFIEVKTRASDWFAPPQINVDRRKQRQISRAARVYRRMFDLTSESYRYDVVTVVMPAEVSASRVDGERRPGPEVQLLRNFWREDQFRKRSWSGNYYE